MKSKFEIGDMAYWVHAGTKEKWVTCPECLGSGRLRVILGDNSEVSIDCVCCERGYEGSPGRIHSYAYESAVSPVFIVGLEIGAANGKPRTTYKLDCGRHVSEEDLFTEYGEDALTRAKELVAQYEAEETKRLKYKENQARTWAWNVSYHRKRIREAHRDIEYHTSKLNAAPKNVKDADAKSA